MDGMSGVKFRKGDSKWGKSSVCPGGSTHAPGQETLEEKPEGERTSCGPLGWTFQVKSLGLIWCPEVAACPLIAGTARRPTEKMRRDGREAGCSWEVRVGFEQRSPLSLLKLYKEPSEAPSVQDKCFSGGQLHHCHHQPIKKVWWPAPGMSAVRGKQ